MKILLLGATGMVGSRVAAEARNRGHEVTGVTRTGSDGTEAAHAKDADAIARLAAGHDAVVMSIVPPRDGSDPTEGLLESARGVVEGMRRAGVKRLVIVGGAGSLEVAPGTRLVDTPEFPQEYKREALAQAELLGVVRERFGDLEWTYISPAIVIEPGERTGGYRVGGDEVLFVAEGNSRITAEDFAIGLVDILEKGEAVRRRITLAH
jgi:putative NADH-flavin reductase